MEAVLEPMSTLADEELLVMVDMILCYDLRHRTGQDTTDLCGLTMDSSIATVVIQFSSGNVHKWRSF